MLIGVRYIQNIGRFQIAKPTRDAKFGKCTFVFGENGWGKSTLADILRSLSKNKPEILLGRKTLDTEEPSKVVLQFGSQNASYEDGTWLGPRPQIAIYDSTFVNENVYSGDLVSSEHLKAQHNLIIGEEGVQRVNRIVELDDENRENNKAISKIENDLEKHIRPLGLPNMTVDHFIQLDTEPDINNAISDQDHRVQQVRNSGELKLAAEPTLLREPTNANEFRQLLNRSVEDIAQEALDRVRTHITKHECDDRGKTDALETWLETGLSYAREDHCPFCGQHLTDRQLLDSYRDFFSIKYKELALLVKGTRDTFFRYKNSDFREVINQTADQNAASFNYWNKATKLGIPDLCSSDEIIEAMERAADLLDIQFALKQSNLTAKLTGDDVDVALREWDGGCELIRESNESIRTYVNAIRSLKDSIDTDSLPSEVRKLSLLKASKQREKKEVKALADQLASLQAQKKAIAREKAAEKQALSDYGRKLTVELGASINTFLKRLDAGFRIKYHDPNYQTKEPSINYSILVNEVPVSPRDTNLDKPSFRNTLSAGDKSTLALALFLAKVNADSGISETIVVLDDPFTSLDNSRKQFTAIETRKICERSLQTIVLSHDKGFLRLLWEKIDRTDVTSLALQTGARGMATFAPFDIEAATQPRYITERIEIEEFVDGEPYEEKYIRTRLRTVCEDFYRRGDTRLFGQTASLEEIIRKLDDAPFDHPYKGAIEDLRDINEYSRGANHAEIDGNPAEETTKDELKMFCRLVLELTHGF